MAVEESIKYKVNHVTDHRAGEFSLSYLAQVQVVRMQ